MYIGSYNYMYTSTMSILLDYKLSYVHVYRVIYMYISTMSILLDYKFFVYKYYVNITRL